MGHLAQDKKRVLGQGPGSPWLGLAGSTSTSSSGASRRHSPPRGPSDPGCKYVRDSNGSSASETLARGPRAELLRQQCAREQERGRGTPALKGEAALGCPPL